jgi:hypothetical protein
MLRWRGSIPHCGVEKGLRAVNLEVRTHDYTMKCGPEIRHKEELYDVHALRCFTGNQTGPQCEVSQ